MVEASSGRTVVKVTMVVVQSSASPSGGLRSLVCTRAMSRAEYVPRPSPALFPVVAYFWKKRARIASGTSPGLCTSATMDPFSLLSEIPTTDPGGEASIAFFTRLANIE